MRNVDEREKEDRRLNKIETGSEGASGFLFGCFGTAFVLTGLPVLSLYVITGV